jgi:phosphatidylglycerophosphatase C
MEAAVIAFDVDGTLTWTDSFMLFLRFFAGRQRFFLDMLALLPDFALYTVKLIDRDTTKTRLLRKFLAGVPFDTYQARARAFAAVIYPLIARPDAVQRLRTHLGVKDEVAFVSASLDQYLIPWAQSLGVRTVLATRLEVVQGRLSGQMVGRNCRAEEKVARLHDRFGDAPIVAAYGDSAGDTAMLKAAGQGHYRLFQDAPPNRGQILRALYLGQMMERIAAEALP